MRSLWSDPAVWSHTSEGAAWSCNLVANSEVQFNETDDEINADTNNVSGTTTLGMNFSFCGANVPVNNCEISRKLLLR